MGDEMPNHIIKNASLAFSQTWVLITEMLLICRATKIKHIPKRKRHILLTKSTHFTVYGDCQVFVKFFEQIYLKKRPIQSHFLNLTGDPNNKKMLDTDTNKSKETSTLNSSISLLNLY